jgi:hypothetical protein
MEESGPQVTLTGIGSAKAERHPKTTEHEPNVVRDILRIGN